MIAGRQIRAARALLDISQEQLAEATGLTPQAIRKIENGDVQPREGTLADIQRVFNDYGLEFIDSYGVRLKPTGIDIFDGPSRFNEFYDFLYNHLKDNAGDVCLSIYDESLLAKHRKSPEIHRERMIKLFSSGNRTFRILTTKSDFVSFGYAQFKWQPKQHAVPTGFYAFGDCLALMSFVNENSPYIVVIRSGPMTAAYRQSFDIAWQNAQEPPRLRAEAKDD